MPHIAALKAVRRVVSTRQALDENISAPCIQNAGAVCGKAVLTSLIS
jgi:hypothetical protein